MKNTKLEAIETLINLVTNTCLQNKESEIQQIDNEKKLILWIAGLAIGLEIFTLNSIKWESLSRFTAFLYVLSGLAFMYNAFLALVAYQMITRLQSIDTKIKKSYNNQCIFLNGVLYSNLPKLQTLYEDLESGKITLKLKELEYFGRKELLKNPIIKWAKRANSIINESASKVLIFQFIASICLFCIYNRVF